MNKSKISPSQILNGFTSITISALSTNAHFIGKIIIAYVVYITINKIVNFIRKFKPNFDKIIFDPLLLLIVLSLFSLFYIRLLYLDDKQLFLYGFSRVSPSFVFIFFSHLLLSAKFKAVQKIEDLHFTYVDSIEKTNVYIWNIVLAIFYYYAWNAALYLPLEFKFYLFPYLSIFPFYVFAIFFVEKKETLNNI